METDDLWLCSQKPVTDPTGVHILRTIHFNINFNIDFSSKITSYKCSLFFISPHAFLFTPIRATCSARRIHLNSLTPIVKVILFWVTKGILRTNLEVTMLGARGKDYTE
jgi:hypothetical protein